MSNVTRSINIQVSNAAHLNICSINDFTSGTALSATNQNIAPMKHQSFTGSNTSEAMSGTLAFHQNNYQGLECLTVAYCASSQADNTSLSITPIAAFAASISSETIGASSVVANITLYDGRPQREGSTIMIMSLTATPMTIANAFSYVFADLTNAMFNTGVRNVDGIATVSTHITSSVGAGMPPAIHYYDLTGGQLKTMVAMLSSCWMTGDATKCAAPDAYLIGLLKGFISATPSPPMLWIPEIDYAATKGKAAVFTLSGYAGLSFFDGGNWNQTAVDTFLTLLVAGAHIVTICATNDVGGYNRNRDFYAWFNGSSAWGRPDGGTSHYCSPLSTTNTARYYLNITGETMPATVAYDYVDEAIGPAGILNAFMTGKTVPDATDGGDYNAYIQLEGWQQQGMTGGTRHMADYSSFKDTRWNMSTFAACPYSETRATAVFLAPPGWQPLVTKTIGMMPYVGAYGSEWINEGAAHQTVDGPYPPDWMHPDLVGIPADAAPLSSAYITVHTSHAS
ncbi:hypothetical protein [Sphingomonas alpina]|uniref:Uncharacterized protein n=1 Tax=Sphingomonas alpina TaxID=653931 RepID=A0A7H0LGE7_9SPHN|nr:hypothetical protein [Sphingomonas alpina]QNQ08750.1 hypothetical protein H3Z74_18795 [Sphingomonas alpina]